MSLLGISAEAGESGSVVRLSGEADLSDVGQLGDALSALISSGARHLTVDLSGLRFADSAAIGTLVEAHLALKRQGGTLELAELQPEVARTLSLLGVDQVIPVRPQADPVPAEAGTGSSLPDAYRSTRPVRRNAAGQVGADLPRTGDEFTCLEVPGRIDRQGVDVQAEQFQNAAQRRTAGPQPGHPGSDYGGTTFHFLDASPAEALSQARDAAGGQDVRLGGGPSVVRDFLAGGLVDHMHVVQVPIVLGRGVRLWDGLESLEEAYNIEAVSTPSGVTRLTFTAKSR